MTREEYLKHRRPLEEKIEQCQKKVAEYQRKEAESQKKLEALDIVWEMINGGNVQNPPVKAILIERPQNLQPPSQNGQSGHSLSLKAMIENIVENVGFDEDITQPIIAGRLKRDYPEAQQKITTASISWTLNRLEKAGKVTLLKKGRGGEPFIYRRRKQQVSQAELDEMFNDKAGVNS